MCDFDDEQRKFRKRFPWLSCTVTSPETNTFNSVAHAVNEKKRWWSLDALNQCYWPPDLLCKSETLEAYEEVFLSLGYEICTDANHEPNFEKVAIYVINGQPSHVARQKEDGMWTSKILKYQDVEHNTTKEIYDSPDPPPGMIFGTVGSILKRAIQE